MLNSSHNNQHSALMLAELTGIRSLWAKELNAHAMHPVHGDKGFIKLLCMSQAIQVWCKKFAKVKKVLMRNNLPSIIFSESGSHHLVDRFDKCDESA